MGYFRKNNQRSELYKVYRVVFIIIATVICVTRILSTQLHSRRFLHSHSFAYKSTRLERFLTHVDTNFFLVSKLRSRYASLQKQHGAPPSSYFQPPNWPRTFKILEKKKQNNRSYLARTVTRRPLITVRISDKASVVRDFPRIHCTATPLAMRARLSSVKLG